MALTMPDNFWIGLGGSFSKSAMSGRKHRRTSHCGLICDSVPEKQRKPIKRVVDWYANERAKIAKG